MFIMTLESVTDLEILSKGHNTCIFKIVGALLILWVNFLYCISNYWVNLVLYMYIILRKIKNPVGAAAPKQHNIDPA